MKAGAKERFPSWPTALEFSSFWPTWTPCRRRVGSRNGVAAPKRGRRAARPRKERQRPSVVAETAHPLAPRTPTRSGSNTSCRFSPPRRLGVSAFSFWSAIATVVIAPSYPLLFSTRASTFPTPGWLSWLQADSGCASTFSRVHAKAHLSALVDEAEHKRKPVLILRHGKPGSHPRGGSRCARSTWRWPSVGVPFVK